MDFLDSNTFIGDAQIFHLWSSKIKKYFTIS